jgi:hypothetical protein
MPFKKEIQSTKTYKSLSVLQQSIMIKLNSQNDFLNTVLVTKNIGYEEYKQCDLSASAKKIFHELINFKPKIISNENRISIKKA